MIRLLVPLAALLLALPLLAQEADVAEEAGESAGEPIER